MKIEFFGGKNVWIFVVPAIILICACTLLAVLYVRHVEQSMDDNGIQSYRLSRFIMPVHYTIQIKPDFDKDIFYGTTSVYIYTESPLEEIILHSRDLNISETYINGEKAVVRYNDYEMISVSYENETIQPGVHHMYFNYTGVIFELNGGFIKAPFGYEDEDIHSTAYIYVTDLEPNNARKIFPCFDEPYFKAKFNIRLVAPEGYDAISNMPEINKFSSSEGTIHTFETTVKMSTYLVSFAFSQFPNYEDKLEINGNSWPIRVYSLNASKENNEFAIECVKKALKFYSEFTNISYPLPKLDMIEYERNESAATENWGLITFRKGLLSPGLKLYFKNQIEIVIFHELSHFWFGNLVTNDWWNDLWLQEGFAVYMSYKLAALENNITQFKYMLEYQFDVFMEIEYTNQSNPVVSYISQQEDILKKFDNLVYDKGAAVLLMLEEIMGEDNFKLAIRKFLKKYSYQTAHTNDFISIVEEIIPDQPIRTFLEKFLYQNKFPLLTIEDENGTFILKQEVSQSPLFPPSKKRWTIPIEYITDKDNITDSKFIWFDQGMDTLEIMESDVKWIVFNPRGLGMYRVQLSANMWRNLIKNFEAMDRQIANSVISNAVFLFKSNLINCDIIINFLKEVKNGRKLSIFGEFNTMILKSLNCSKKSDYKDAAQIYLKFIDQRYNETKSEKRFYSLLSKLCDQTDTMDIGENLEECVNWITDNLDETSNDIIKNTES